MDAVPIDAIRAALANADDSADANRLRDHVEELTDAPPNGTLRAWCQDHDGAIIDTVQVGYGGWLWAPLARKLDATRPSFLTLDGSRREYAGMRVVAVTSDAILTASGEETILYAAQK